MKTWSQIIEKCKGLRFTTGLVTSCNGEGLTAKYSSFIPSCALHCQLPLLSSFNFSVMRTHSHHLYCNKYLAQPRWSVYRLNSLLVILLERILSILYSTLSHKFLCRKIAAAQGFQGQFSTSYPSTEKERKDTRGNGCYIPGSNKFSRQLGIECENIMLSTFQLESIVQNIATARSRDSTFTVVKKEKHSRWTINQETINSIPDRYAGCSQLWNKIT